MRWLQSEYILKGIYLGVLLLVAVQVPDWRAVGAVALCMLGGLVLALGIAAARKLREGYRVKGRLPAFVLFLVLESPSLVYTGIILGTLLGAYLAIPRPEGPENWHLPIAVGGGAVLGVLFGALRELQHRWTRLGLSLLLGAGLVAGVLYLFGEFPDFKPEHLLTWKDPTLFGSQLLIGIPIFYLLTFAGKEEESEVEIGAVCAALGLSLGILTRELFQFRAVGFIVPIMLYFYYTTQVLPRLRVFKHAVRGFSYTNVGRYRQALLSFRRAVQLDPRNRLAREGLWSVHRAMDLTQVARDPETLALIDFNLCLDRAGSLLLEPNPSLAKLEEAQRLLDLVLGLRPGMLPAVQYWRAIALTHGRDYDQATVALASIVDPDGPDAGSPHRRGVLFQAWQLGLMLHPELRRRLGQPQLAMPGRRMEAIGAVERQLAAAPDDAGAWDLKRVLYADLTEADYARAAGDQPAVPDFDHGYAQQLGLALIDDPARWQRGAEFLRMAARGMPTLGPSIFTQIARAHEQAGNTEGMWHNYELAKRAGRAIGPRNLPEEDRHQYFSTLKLLAEAAAARGDLDAAIENYHLYTEYERSGLPTLRALADLHEKKGDPLAALRVTEQALSYNSQDKELLERKDKYCYSIDPEHLKPHLESVRPWFDFSYCIRKAAALLSMRNADLDLVDWALHLARLAQIVQPASVSAIVLRARAHLRRGERDEALKLLEDARTGKPEKFASADDEEAWYLSCKLLADLYLNEVSRPDLAVQALQDFRKSPKSGADTMYKLGQAYEQLGDRARALKCYEHVTTYDAHPLAPEAREAIYRLQSG